MGVHVQYPCGKQAYYFRINFRMSAPDRKSSHIIINKLKQGGFYGINRIKSKCLVLSEEKLHEISVGSNISPKVGRFLAQETRI